MKKNKQLKPQNQRKTKQKINKQTRILLQKTLKVNVYKASPPPTLQKKTGVLTNLLSNFWLINFF